MQHLIATLLDGHHSLVVASGGQTRTYDGRGVADLYRLLHESPDVLQGALVADKIVGKAAAALMVLGKVKQAYADVISTPAMQMLNEAGITTGYATLVPHIINRAGTGLCPLETRCLPCATAEECLVQTSAFISEMKRRHDKE